MSPATPPATGRPRPRRGEQVEIEIASLAHGGRGLGRDRGFVLFVAGALPGDVVRAEVTKPKRRYAEARLVELVRPSPERVAFDGEPSPGAPWAELDYERQLHYKAEQLGDALGRLGGFDRVEQRPIVAAEQQWRYRNKFEFAFGQDGEQLVCGFHPRGRWDVVVDSQDTPLASAAVNAARNAVRDWGRARGLEGYDPRDGRGTLRHLVVREGRRTGQLQTRLVVSPSVIPEPPVDLLTTVAPDSGGTEGPSEILGREHLLERLCDLELRISPEAFFQTNTEMAERLYAIAAEAAQLTGHERVFDLFCGIGTLGLTLAEQARELWGVEVIPEAVADAEHNAARNGIANARFVAANVRTGVRPLLEQAGPPDVLVVDPPRAGLSAKLVRRVVECEAPRIVYVSCNPTTLAPDAAQLRDAGYALRWTQPVDLFPQTPHIESVTLLERA